MTRLNKHSLNTSEADAILQVKTTCADVAGWIVLALIALVFWVVVLGASYGAIKFMSWLFLNGA